MSTRKPLIGIPADRRLLGHHYFHCVGEKYINAVAEGAQAVPVLIPSLGEVLDARELLADFDGILLTGSPSNVEPHRYSGPASDPGTLHDAWRDATTLPMISQVIDAGLPLLAICRGFQEMNVAFGGTLWQKLQEVEGYRDHRENKDAPLDEQYGPVHEIELTQGGLLHRLAGQVRQESRLLQDVPKGPRPLSAEEPVRLKVNSLHAQGVQTLGRGLTVEARAADGVIEAFSVPHAPSFAVGVQWHPEWKFKDNLFSRALFAAFGEAALQRARRRAGNET